MAFDACQLNWGSKYRPRLHSAEPDRGNPGKTHTAAAFFCPPENIDLSKIEELQHTGDETYLNKLRRLLTKK